jgi:hypothetical protein
MTTVVVEFDGTTFVPQQPVDLPVGTRATVAIADLPAEVFRPPRQPTDEDRARWEELMAQLNATEPHFPTMEDAIGYSRGRPGYDHP